MGNRERTNYYILAWTSGLMVVSFIYMEQTELSEKTIRMVRAINIILNKFQRSLNIAKSVMYMKFRANLGQKYITGSHEHIVDM